MESLFPDLPCEDPGMDELTAFIEARLAEDKSVADGLMFACRIPEKKPDFFACGGPAAEEYWRRFDPRRMLAEVEGTTRLVAEITATPHLYIEGDSWFSCSQAVPEAWPGRDDEPGSGCADDDRRGKPCDCGRDAKARRQLRLIAQRWGRHPEYKPAWAAVVA